MLQTLLIETSAAGFVHLASLKRFTSGLWNDVTQVAGCIPTMFIDGDRDCVVELATLLDYVLSYISLAAVKPLPEATKRGLTVIVPGANHYSYLDAGELVPGGGVDPLARGDCVPTLPQARAQEVLGNLVAAFIAVHVHEEGEAGGYAEAALKLLQEQVEVGLERLNPLAMAFGYGDVKAAYKQVADQQYAHQGAVVARDVAGTAA